MAIEIDYSAVLLDLEAKRAAIDSAIAGVRQMLNLGAEQGVGGGTTSATNERREQAGSVRFDSFFRMPMPAAIVKFLDIAKVPQSVSEVTAALLAGGFKTTSKNLMPIVGSNLSRLKSAGETVNVEGKWGLASWYPAARKSDTAQKKRPKTKKSKVDSESSKAKTASKSSKFSAEQIEQMRKLQTAGRSLADIGKEFGVHHLTILHLLKDKRG